MRSEKRHIAVIKEPKHKTVSNIKSTPFNWIAKHMGHATIEMLFFVYSRFVTNMTRQDGGAFKRILLRSTTANPNSAAAAY